MKNDKKIIYVLMVLVLTLDITCNINHSQLEYTINEFENEMSDSIKGNMLSNFLLFKSTSKIKMNDKDYFLILFEWNGCYLDTFGYIRLDIDNNQLFYLHPLFNKLQDKTHPASKEQTMLKFFRTNTINTFYGNGWLFGGNNAIKLKTIYYDEDIKDTIYNFDIIDTLSTAPSIHGYDIKRFGFSKKSGFIEFTISQYDYLYSFKKTCFRISGKVL